jgi:hypothetical protein
MSNDAFAQAAVPTRATVLNAPRVRGGVPATTEIAASYTPADAAGPALLAILSDFSPRRFDWRRKTVFRVEEVPTPTGRGFMLHRPEADVARDGADADTFYGTLVAYSPLDHTCSCRGFQAHGHCRHHDALRALLEAGCIDPAPAAAS